MTRPFQYAAPALLAAALGATSVAIAEEPNNFFGVATTLAPNVRVVEDELTGPFPDTTLGAFNELGELIRFDDDGSDFGDGFASGLFNIPVNADGSIRLAVSGFADFDFDGLSDSSGTPHAQQGPFDIDVEVVIEQDPPEADRQVFEFDDGELTPGGVVEFLFQDPEYVGGVFFVNIDNEVAAGAEFDIDFYRFTGLIPGVPFVAEVTDSFEDIDSVLGLFDPVTGALIDFDDDGGAGVLSLIEGVAPASGEIVLAVTGFDDFDFGGDHEETGDYTLVVSQVPEPLGAAAAGVLVIGVWLRRRAAK